MKNTGIVRKLDDLGRFVIPMELCKVMDLKRADQKGNGTPMGIYTEGDLIILKKYEPACIFCGDARNVINYKGKNICKNCLDELTNS